MNQYEWRVIALDIRPSDNGLDNVVVGVSYEVTVYDPDVGDTAGTQMRANCGAPNTEDFTPYSQLTEAQVIEWVQTSLGENIIAEVYAFLDSLLINNRKPAITQLPLPWA